MTEVQNLLPDSDLVGSWETSKRSMTTAAVLGFIIVGTIYAYGLGIFGFIAVAVHGIGGSGTASTGQTFVDLLSEKAILTKAPIRLSIMVSEFIFMLVPTLWLIRRWHTRSVAAYIRLHKTGIKEILLAVSASVLFFPVNAFLSDLLLKGLDFPDFLTRINSEIFTSYNSGEFFWVILVVCVTPAICEETFFRGYVQRTFERTLGAKSIIITGILFGLYHMRPINLVSLVILGMIIGFFFYRSKSILPGAAAHFTNNFIAVLTLYRYSDGRPRVPYMSGQFPAYLVIIGIIGTAAVIVLYYRTTRQNFGQNTARQSETAPEAT